MSSRFSGRKRGAAAAMTGALALVAASIGLASPAAAAGTLDQSATSITFMGTLVQNDSMTVSQTFTAGVSGLLTEVDLSLGKTGSPTSALVAITAVDGSGNPTGAALASEVVSAASFSGLGSVTTVAFSSPATITARTQYAIVLSCSGCGTGGPMGTTIDVYLASNPYAGGVADNSAFSPWAAGSLDFFFATYVSPTSIAPVAGSPSPSPPPPPADILQQVGLPKSGTCADVDDSKLNWAGVSTGGWGASWAKWMNDGRGGAICGRTMTYTSAGRWAVRV